MAGHSQQSTIHLTRPVVLGMEVFIACRTIEQDSTDCRCSRKDEPYWTSQAKIIRSLQSENRGSSKVGISGAAGLVLSATCKTHLLTRWFLTTISHHHRCPSSRQTHTSLTARDTSSVVSPPPGQGAPLRPEGRRGSIRAHQRLRFVLPQQVEVPRLPAQASLGQPQEGRSLPPPCSLAHPLQDHPRNASPQDRPWCRRPPAIEDLRGCPPPYDRKKLMVIPAALRVLRLKPGRKFATIKRISHEVGWNHMETVDKLEAKRKVQAAGLPRATGRCFQEARRRYHRHRQQAQGPSTPSSLRTATKRLLHPHLPPTRCIVPVVVAPAVPITATASPILCISPDLFTKMIFVQTFEHCGL